MKMRLSPLFNSAGQLLGHINLALCIQSHNGYVMDEHAGRVGPYVTMAAGADPDTCRIFRFPIKRIRFRWGADDEQTVRYLVVDEPIPEWVWKAAGIKFAGDSWERE